MRRPLVEEFVELGATVQHLDTLHAALDRFWAAIALVPPGEGNGTDPARVGATTRHQVSIAVAEVGANIADHGHPTGAAAGTMRLRLRLYRNRIEVIFTDRGLAYVEQPRDATAVADDPLDLPERGRGMVLARIALDELHYRRTASGTNHWRLVKRLPG